MADALEHQRGQLDEGALRAELVRTWPWVPKDRSTIDEVLGWAKFVAKCAAPLAVFYDGSPDRALCTLALILLAGASLLILSYYFVHLVDRLAKVVYLLVALLVGPARGTLVRGAVLLWLAAAAILPTGFPVLWLPVLAGIGAVFAHADFREAARQYAGLRSVRAIASWTWLGGAVALAVAAWRSDVSTYGASWGYLPSVFLLCASLAVGLGLGWQLERRWAAALGAVALPVVCWALVALRLHVDANALVATWGGPEVVHAESLEADLTEASRLGAALEARGKLAPGAASWSEWLGGVVETQLRERPWRLEADDVSGVATACSGSFPWLCDEAGLAAGADEGLRFVKACSVGDARACTLQAARRADQQVLKALCEGEPDTIACGWSALFDAELRGDGDARSAAAVSRCEEGEVSGCWAGALMLVGSTPAGREDAGRVAWAGKRACEAGEASGCLLVGLASSVPQGERGALLVEACERGLGLACRLAEALESDGEVQSILDAACERGDPLACLRSGSVGSGACDRGWTLSCAAEAWRVRVRAPATPVDVRVAALCERGFDDACRAAAVASSGAASAAQLAAWCEAGSGEACARLAATEEAKAPAQASAHWLYACERGLSAACDALVRVVGASASAAHSEPVRVGYRREAARLCERLKTKEACSRAGAVAVDPRWGAADPAMAMGALERVEALVIDAIALRQARGHQDDVGVLEAWSASSTLPVAARLRAAQALVALVKEPASRSKATYRACSLGGTAACAALRSVALPGPPTIDLGWQSRRWDGAAAACVRSPSLSTLSRGSDVVAEECLLHLAWLGGEGRIAEATRLAADLCKAGWVGSLHAGTYCRLEQTAKQAASAVAYCAGRLPLAWIQSVDSPSNDLKDCARRRCFRAIEGPASLKRCEDMGYGLDAYLAAIAADAP
jgi:hypothetical protein